MKAIAAAFIVMVAACCLFAFWLLYGSDGEQRRAVGTTLRKSLLILFAGLIAATLVTIPIFLLSLNTPRFF